VSSSRPATAFESLELGGFDRADLDALSNLVEVPRSIGALDVTTEKQTKIPRTTEQPVIMSEDVVAAKAVIAGTLGTICALAAVSWVVASGGGPALAVLGALLAGVAAGGIGYVATPRLLGSERTKSSESLAAVSGFNLRVRVGSRDREQKAQEILRERGASAIRARDSEIEKRPEDIPFSSLRPDPWLGNDRLGQP
jgi:hypothetical protein